MGRKSKYVSHIEPYLEEIPKLVRQGRTEEDISKMLGVAYSTFREYKDKYTALSAALKNGKVTLVQDIKDSMFRSALGLITIKKTKKTYIKDHRTGKMILDKEEVNEDMLAPNITAQIAALKILSPEDREILTNNIQIDNQNNNTALENFHLVSDELKRSIKDEKSDTEE